MGTEFFRAGILGIVQGVSEFLPISSSGHLLLIRYFLGWEDEGLLFDAVLHLGSLFAILLVFWPQWKTMGISLYKKREQAARMRLLLIIVATIPAAITGFLFEDALSETLRNRNIVVLGFGITAFLLIASELRSRYQKFGVDISVRLPQAFSVGIMQVLALLPGISRSGSTIAGGMVAGLSRSRAVEFSFLIALPIMGGAGFKSLIDSMGEDMVRPGVLVIGFVCAFFSSWIAMRVMLRYIRMYSLFPFAGYLVFLIVLFSLGVW